MGTVAPAIGSVTDTFRQASTRSRLTVVDPTGSMGVATAEVTVTNRQPVALIQFSCGALRCYFTGSPSSDADGTIVSYAWSFGDGTQAADVSPIHTFAAAGTYSVGLTVADNSGATGTAVMTVTVAAPRVMHSGDLDAAKTVRNQSWDVFYTVTVHDAAHQPVANAFVVGSWTTGSGGCTTANLGVCTIARYGFANSTSSTTLPCTPSCPTERRTTQPVITTPKGKRTGPASRYERKRKSQTARGAMFPS